MPTGAANHRIEHHGWNFFNKRPVVADPHAERIQAVRQDAFVAQQNRMQLQDFAFLKALRPDELEARGAASGTAIFTWLAVPVSSPEKPVASGWLIDLPRRIPLRLR